MIPIDRVDKLCVKAKGLFCLFANQSGQVTGAWDITGHDMVLNETVQRIDTVLQILKTMTRCIHVFWENRIIDFAGQIIQRAQVAVGCGDTIFLKLSLIERVGLDKSSETVLPGIWHPCHLLPNV